MNFKFENFKIFIECLKGFSVGAIFGLLIIYFRKLDSFVPIIICGFVTMSIHIRNNSYKINKKE
ncbi:hypothetical protein [Flavobacterium sp.]|uniref:hypothetical protein n=1 Tax=Flavobacterium sp. TaxID=239 RepID=UPI003752756B